MVEFNFEKYFSGIKPKKITSPTAPNKKQSPKTLWVRRKKAS